MRHTERNRDKDKKRDSEAKERHFAEKGRSHFHNSCSVTNQLQGCSQGAENADPEAKGADRALGFTATHLLHHFRVCFPVSLKD